MAARLSMVRVLSHCTAVSGGNELLSVLLPARTVLAALQVQLPGFVMTQQMVGLSRIFPTAHRMYFYISSHRSLLPRAFFHIPCFFNIVLAVIPRL